MTDEDQNKSPKEPDTPSGMASFWAELKRRKVMRVAITYAVVAWLIMQVAGLTFEGFGVPIWAFRFVVIVLWLFFPVAIILTWAFELTPEGIKTTKNARENQSEEPVSKTQQRKRNWFTFLFGAAVPTVVFGTLAIFFYFRSGPPVSPDVSGGGSPHQVEALEKSIAVLPLENMSPDPENAFFADGVQEDILSNLSKIDDLGLVIGRTSTLQYRDTVKTLKKIGEELGVQYLLQGSVRRAGDQVNVSVQLINSQSEGQLWTANYTRKLDDIFAVQVEVAMEIAGQLQAVISPEEIEMIEYRPTQNQEAYDYFVKLRQLNELNFGYEDEKVGLLEKAVAIDPEFAEAWAQLALERISLWVRKNRNDPELLAKAHYALKQARRYGPNLPNIRHAQSFFTHDEDQDIEATISLLLEALAIDPGFRFAQRILANQYRNLGRLSEAQHYAEAVLSTDPLSFRSNRDLLWVYQFRRNWDQARALIQANLERGDGQDHWQERLVHLDYLQTGGRQSFISGIEAAPGFLDNPNRRVVMALIRRDFPPALQLLEEWESDGVLAYIINRYRLSIGPTDLAKALIHFEQEDNKQWLIEAKSAKTQLEAITELDPKSNPFYFSRLAICHALEGDHERMETAITITREKTRSNFFKYRFQAECEIHIAIAYIALGDHDKAIDTLEAASNMDGPIFLNRELDLWFIFDRLRGNPRFDALLEG